jgi:molecular chaperone GrpE (heat shock protein)
MKGWKQDQPKRRANLPAEVLADWGSTERKRVRRLKQEGCAMKSKGRTKPDSPHVGESESFPPTREQEELASLRRQVAELGEGNLRLVAEMQNLQKRVQREQEQIVRFAESELARELCSVLDDLERARASATTTRDPEKLTAGLSLICEHILKVLRDRQI